MEVKEEEERDRIAADRGYGNASASSPRSGRPAASYGQTRHFAGIGPLRVGGSPGRRGVAGLPVPTLVLWARDRPGIEKLDPTPCARKKARSATTGSTVWP